MKKKPSPAQLRARALFAKRAKARSFKKNPSPEMLSARAALGAIDVGLGKRNVAANKNAKAAPKAAKKKLAKAEKKAEVAVKKAKVAVVAAAKEEKKVEKAGKKARKAKGGKRKSAHKAAAVHHTSAVKTERKAAKRKTAKKSVAKKPKTAAPRRSGKGRKRSHGRSAATAMEHTVAAVVEPKKKRGKSKAKAAATPKKKRRTAAQKAASAKNLAKGRKASKSKSKKKHGKAKSSAKKKHASAPKKTRKSSGKRKRTNVSKGHHHAKRPGSKKLLKRIRKGKAVSTRPRVSSRSVSGSLKGRTRSDRKGIFLDRSAMKDFRPLRKDTRTEFLDLKNPHRRAVLKVRTNYAKNPADGWKGVAMVVGLGAVGAVAWDLIDRFLATRGVNGRPASTGYNAVERIQVRPGGMRIGIELGAAALVAGLAFAVDKKVKGERGKMLSSALAGIAAGGGIYTVGKLVSDYVMPMAFKVSPAGSPPAIGDRLYYLEQDQIQKQIESDIANQDATGSTVSTFYGTAGLPKSTGLGGIPKMLGALDWKRLPQKQPARVGAPALPASARFAQKPAQLGCGGGCGKKKSDCGCGCKDGGSASDGTLTVIPNTLTPTNYPPVVQQVPPGFIMTTDGTLIPAGGSSATVPAAGGASGGSGTTVLVTAQGSGGQAEPRQDIPVSGSGGGTLTYLVTPASPIHSSASLFGRSAAAAASASLHGLPAAKREAAKKPSLFRLSLHLLPEGGARCGCPRLIEVLLFLSS